MSEPRRCGGFAHRLESVVGWFGSGWGEDGVDHVDDAVGGEDVGLDDRRRRRW